MNIVLKGGKRKNQTMIFLIYTNFHTLVALEKCKTGVMLFSVTRISSTSKDLRVQKVFNQRKTNDRIREKKTCNSEFCQRFRSDVRLNFHPFYTRQIY